MDFYNQHRFVCEISGHSNLTYWEALESETNEAREVDEIFPESLKEPVLRRLQFSTTSRLDHLVDEVYDTFKSDFYPGEYAFALINNDKLEVIIREKAQFNAIQMPDGEVRPAYAKYRVEMIGHGREGQEDVVDGMQLNRDRKRFSKSMLRTFMKNSLSREPWSGAPWLVKAKYAKKYRIDTNIPPHLQRNNGLSDAEVAANQAKKLKEKRRLLHLAERAKLTREKEDHKELARKEKEELREKEKREREASKRPPSTEDLDLIPMFDPPSQRPKLKIERSFPMEWIGSLLQSWSFFNVFHETLLLSLFTFDEYIGALQYSSADLPCELFVELNCALLKLVIDNESSEYAIDLPPVPQHEENTSPKLENVVVKAEETDQSDDNTEQNKREESSGSAESEEESESIKILNSLSKWRDGNWKERLRRRLFVAGGMELIILNLLHEVSYVSQWKDFCTEIIESCLPADEQVSADALKARYSQLAPVHKLRVLEILIELVRDSNAIRERIEFCMEESTRIRRERLETHKEHKALLEQIRVAEEEKREILPLEPASSEGEEDKKTRKISREEIESRVTRTNPIYKKLVQKIEMAQQGVQKCIAALKMAEVELRTLDCQRFRILGRDRFYNRYWWFESNGMPTDLGRHHYLMGRLWIQGPSDEDLEVFVTGGMAAYGELSLAERKDMEVEDIESQVNGVNDWGYIDDPDDIKELHHWLGTKGLREPRLRKELDSRRAGVEASMIARRKYMGLNNEREEKDTPEIVKESSIQPESRDESEDEDGRLRRSSRQRKRVIAQEEADLIARDYRFLGWRNSAAVQILGKSHYESGYKKLGSDLLVQKSQNFASPASAAASAATSAKPSPQPTMADERQPQSSAESSPAPPESSSVTESSSTSSSAVDATAVSSSLKRSLEAAEIEQDMTPMVTRKQARKRQSAPLPSTSTTIVVEPEEPERRVTRRSAAAFESGGTPVVATPERGTNAYGTRSTRSSLAKSTPQSETSTPIVESGIERRSTRKSAAGAGGNTH